MKAGAVDAEWSPETIQLSVTDCTVVGRTPLKVTILPREERCGI
jgi:hypothetical protein